MKFVSFIIVAATIAFVLLKDPTVTSKVNDVTFSYIVKYPAGVDKKAVLPMLVALHGNGDKPKNFYESALDAYTQPVRIVVLQGPISFGWGKAWPWQAESLTRYGDALHDVIVSLANKYPTQGKPALLGFSGGGQMAYYQAVTHGGDYSYIFPISGRLSTADLATTQLPDQRRSKVKVHAFHGKKDSVVGFSKGQEAVKILKERGVRVVFTEFDGDHQGVFRSMKMRITNIVQQYLAKVATND